MTIKGRLILRKENDKWQMSLMDKDSLLRQIVYKFGTSDHIILDVKFSKGIRPKSKSQNGYFFAEIVPRITDALNEQGFDMDEDNTYHWLKLRFLGYDEIPDPETGEIIKVPHKLEGADHNTFNEFTTNCMKFGETSLNITFQTPEEYMNQFVVQRI
jgi:hypothetical protein